MTISYTKTQRAVLVGGLVLLFVVGLLGRLSSGAVIGAIVGALFTFGTEVRLEPPGAVLRFGVRTVRVPWGDIASVERRRRFGSDRVAFQLRDGRTRWLPVPYSGWIVKNREMDAQAAAIEAAWRAGYAQGHGTLPT